jgi:hypothetical protein
MNGGLGRRAHRDPRDHNYWLLDAMPRVLQRPSVKYWPFMRDPLDQGQTGTCVGHGWKGWMLAAPVTRTTPDAEPTAMTIYREATTLDEWADNDGDLQAGTSVRAGAKALLARGHIREYRWCWDLKTAVDFLLTGGPVVIGVNFYEGMFDLDANGFMGVGGNFVGGHCMLLLGANEPRRVVRGLNSWGKGWGQKGRFWMTFSDLERLISENGEVCAAVEIKLP